MQVNFAHLREASTTGRYIDYAIFEARSASGQSHDNQTLLAQLTMKARASGLKVDQSALAFQENGRLKFWGSPGIVNEWARRGVPRWTHTLSV